jgi:DNA-binding transcriptional MocR family regulator
MPRGGFYLWCRLPGEMDSAALARMALSENVVLAPGDVFSVSRTASGYLRFNVAQAGSAQVFDVLGRAMRAATGIGSSARANSA